MLGKSVSGSQIHLTSFSWSGRRATATPLARRRASLILGETRRAVAPMVAPRKKDREVSGLERAQPAPRTTTNLVSEETKAPETMAATRRGLDDGGEENKGSKGNSMVTRDLMTKTRSRRFASRNGCGLTTPTSKGNRRTVASRPSQLA